MEKGSDIVFNEYNALVYGRWIGARYRNASNLVWILGRDRRLTGTIGWLDFNMLQSGHAMRDKRNDDMLRAGYNLRPVKPVLDGEPRYDNHPVNWKPEDLG